MKFNFEKVILPGSFRYIGMQMNDWGPADIPIAARTGPALEKHFGGYCFKLGRRKIENVLIVEKNPLRLIYVRPRYTEYRAAAMEIFTRAQWSFVIDHCLGRQIAAQWGYAYVLLQRIDLRINSQHGFFERSLSSLSTYPDLCFSDMRIRNKALHRGPRFWGRERLIYNPAFPNDAGLTLKQLGRWGWALGVESIFEKHPKLRQVELIQ